MKKKKKMIGVIIFICFIIWIIITNVFVEINIEEVTYENLPESFDGFKIVQISDFHNSRIVAGSDGLIEKIEASNPDIIAITGVDDPDFTLHAGVGRSMLPNAISELSTEDSFSILLSHRPEYYDAYKKSDANLVLSGHATEDSSVCRL